MTDTRFKRIEKKKTQELISYDHSVWKDIKKELFSNKIALVSIVILLIIIIASILAPLSPYDPNKINVAEKLQGISAKHIFGTDEYGRDYFTRALYGGRISLTVGFCSMIMTVILGTAIGITSGYFGGKVDMFLMRFTDIFHSFSFSAVFYGNIGTRSRPSLSGSPKIRFMFCTACPAAPFTRLSIAPIIMIRFVLGSILNPIST